MINDRDDTKAEHQIKIDGFENRLGRFENKLGQDELGHNENSKDDEDRVDIVLHERRNLESGRVVTKRGLRSKPQIAGTKRFFGWMKRNGERPYNRDCPANGDDTEQN